MSRKRDLSSDISHDKKIAELSESEHGYLAVALYMMAIPQADDWGRLPGDAREFKMLVCPGFDTPRAEIDAVITEIAATGLWDRYEAEGKECIAFPPVPWFKRQTYINVSKRSDDSGSLYPSNQQFRDYARAQSAEITLTLPQNSKEQQETAKTSKKRHYARASPSPSPSPSLSPSPSVTETASPSGAREAKSGTATKPPVREKQRKPPIDPEPPDEVPIRDVTAEGANEIADESPPGPSAAESEVRPKPSRLLEYAAQHPPPPLLTRSVLAAVYDKIDRGVKHGTP